MEDLHSAVVYDTSKQIRYSLSVKCSGIIYGMSWIFVCGLQIC